MRAAFHARHAGKEAPDAPRALARSAHRQAERTAATGENCWPPPSAFSPRTDLKRPASKTSPPAPDTRAALFTPILRARKTSSLPCSRNGSGSESSPSPTPSAATRIRSKNSPRFANPLCRARQRPPPGSDLPGIQALCLAPPRSACPAAEQAPPHSRVVWRALFRIAATRSGKSLPIANPAASACLGALAQGLLLEHLVDPKTLSDGRRPPRAGPFFRFDLFGLRAAQVSRAA